MKRIMRLILIILLLIPFSIKATTICSGVASNGSITNCKVSYGSAIDIANSYFVNIVDQNGGIAKDYSFYKRYFRLPKNENSVSTSDLLKYDCRLLSSTLVCNINPLFKFGTLISAREFILSNYKMDGSSYLLSGINNISSNDSIWTSTNSDSANNIGDLKNIGLCDDAAFENILYGGNKVFSNVEKYKCVRYYGMTNVMNSSKKDGTVVLYPKDSNKGSNEDKAYVKAATYLGDDVRVSGDGTSDNPWVILKKYYADPNNITVKTSEVDSSDKCKITLQIPSGTLDEEAALETRKCGKSSDKLVCYEDQKAEFKLKYSSDSDCANIKNNLDVISPTIPQFSNAYLNLSEGTLVIPKLDLDIDESFKVNIQLNYKEFDIKFHASNDNENPNGNFTDGSLEKTKKVRYNNTFGTMPEPISKNDSNEYFEGWYTDINCNGNKITSTSYFVDKSLANSPNLYACYTPRKANFVFVSNGIEGSKEIEYSYTSENNYSYAFRPERTGYTFTGWTDNQNGQILANYEKSGSTTSVNLLHEGNGWAKNNTDKDKYIEAKIKINLKKDVASSPYNVKFNGVDLQEGSTKDYKVTCENGVCTYEIHFTISSNMVTGKPKRSIDFEKKTGADIDHANTDIEIVYVAKYDKKDGKTKNIVFDKDGKSVAALNNEAIKLDYNNKNYMIANWEIKRLNVSYKTSSNVNMRKKGSGTYSTSSIVENVEFFDNYYLEVESEHNDYEFISWKKDNDEIKNYTSIKTDINHDITAQWLGQKVNVMFCPGNIGDNSNCVSVIDGGMRLGQAYGQTVNWQNAKNYDVAFTRDGYVLRGWQDVKGNVLDPNSTTSVVTKGDNNDVDDNYKVYVYAIWKRAITINFDDNHLISNNKYTMNFVVEDYYSTDLPTPSRTLCTFLGWYEKEYSDDPLLDYYYKNNSSVQSECGNRKLDSLKRSCAYNHYKKNPEDKIAPYYSGRIVSEDDNNITLYAGWNCL